MLTGTINEQFTVSSNVKNREPKKELGKDDFLNLMVTQLKNQDPLNPMDNNEFIAQTTQFSSLEQLINMNESIKNLTESFTNNTSNEKLYNAASHIGKEAKFFSNKLFLKDNQALIGYELDSVPKSIEIEVIDSLGNQITKLTPSTYKIGQNELTWDVLNTNGKELPDGFYGFVVNAIDETGSKIPYRSYTSGVVKGVDTLSGELKYDINGLEVGAESVFAIYENRY
jgi:flagellar basal-body rod modification protein FlgD